MKLVYNPNIQQEEFTSLKMINNLVCSLKCYQIKTIKLDIFSLHFDFYADRIAI